MVLTRQSLRLSSDLHRKHKLCLGFDPGNFNTRATERGMGYKHGGVDIVSIYHGNRVRVPSTFGSGSYRVAMIRSDASSAKGTSGHTGGVTECNTKEGALTIEIMNGAKDSMQRVCSSGGSRLSEGQGAYDEEAPEIEYCEPVVVKDGERSRAKVVYVLPEQTPPAVKIVLGQRPGWVEWDAELHTEDEVRERERERKLKRDCQSEREISKIRGGMLHGCFFACFSPE